MQASNNLIILDMLKLPIKSSSQEIIITHKKHKVQFKVVDKLQPKIIYGIPFLEETGILNKFRESVREHLGKKNNSSKN